MAPWQRFLFGFCWKLAIESNIVVCSIIETVLLVQDQDAISIICVDQTLRSSDRESKELRVLDTISGWLSHPAGV